MSVTTCYQVGDEGVMTVMVRVVMVMRVMMRMKMIWNHRFIQSLQ